MATGDVIKIGEKNYFVDDLPESTKTLITDIQKVETELERSALQLSIITFAKNSLVEKLVKETENLVEAEIPAQ